MQALAKEGHGFCQSIETGTWNEREALEERLSVDQLMRCQVKKDVKAFWTDETAWAVGQVNKGLGCMNSHIRAKGTFFFATEIFDQLSQSPNKSSCYYYYF